MSIEFFVSRTWRYASIIAFIVFLLFTYRGLPDSTAVHFNESGRGDGFLPKDEVFYLFVGIMLGINILLILLAKSVEKLPVRAWSWLPNKKWIEEPRQLNESISNWFNFLPAIINTFLILVLRVLLLLNDERTFDSSYTYLIIIGLVLMIAWLFYLPVKLLYTNPEVKAEY